MADTDTETLPNGTGGLSAEEEDERMRQRPADIDADVREMERRKRVEALMSSRLFREELERVLDQQMNEGADAPLLQRIREMVGGRLNAGSMRGPSCVLPINDIRGIEGIGYEKGEKILRCKLAAVYRLVDLFGWTQTGASGQITGRLNTSVEQVLTSPRGLLPHEVTASALVKVDMQGTVHDQGTTNFPVNVAGFSVHASVHAARPDVRCVLHVRSAAALAVSATRGGLLPLSNEAALVGDVAYHHVPPGILDNEEREKIIRILGPSAKILFLTSNGAFCCGETLEEAFYQARNLTAACEVQLKLAAMPLDSLITIDEETRKQIYEASRKPPAEGGKWRVGGEEFEALMRMLDNAGFRTGYIYRHPLIKSDVPKPKNDVECPPAVSSLGYLLEEEEMYKQGLWKKGGGKVGERTRWLNSPNVYQKVEVLETGTNDPKKITKWVDANTGEWIQDGSPAHSSTPVKIDTLQFVPMKTNPKEFKALQQQIKDNRRADKISAGPQSHILEGVTWSEAGKLADDATVTHTGDHVVLMGAASKGIIQRAYQHNATVYSAPYARNPFDDVTATDIAEYTRAVERRARSDYDTDLSESEAISAAQLTSPASDTEGSRDEHRVLRIETKQAPVRSQPEVVLSDVAGLLPDEEVFLPSVTSPEPASHVVHARHVVHASHVVHEGHVGAQRSVARGAKLTDSFTKTQAIRTNPELTRTDHELARTNPELTRTDPELTRTHDSTRMFHEYPRSNNFDSLVKKYDSPNKMEVPRHPKCKVSLQSRLQSSVDTNAVEYDTCVTGSRSSLFSIPSIEWDGRYKPDLFQTRSLPRPNRKSIKPRLFRTQSHAGFINAKDPEPTHFHLPRCNSCGACNYSYVWELTRDVFEGRGNRNVMEDHCGCDDTQKGQVELDLDRTVTTNCDLVTVEEKAVPVYKLEAKAKQVEFVESQEFNEDCYLGELGNSFSSDNQTVIEKASPVTTGSEGSESTIKGVTVVDGTTVEVYDKVVTELNDKFAKQVTNREEYATIEEHEVEDVNNNSVNNIEGEYLNFSDEMDFEKAVYESPVKDLVEKDIRDYSVPIKYYCDDFKQESISPRKSPGKKHEIPAPKILEPILEESKSSYGDDASTSNSFNNDSVAKENEPAADDSKIVPQMVIDEMLQELIVTSEAGLERHERKADGDCKTVPQMVLDEMLQELTKASESIQEITDSVSITIETEEEFVNTKVNTCYFGAEGSYMTTNEIDDESNIVVQTAVDMYVGETEQSLEIVAVDDEDKIVDVVCMNVFEILSNAAINTETSKIQHKTENKRSVSSEYSVGSSTMEIPSFNSTAEFEKYEAVSEILGIIISRFISQTEKYDDVFCNVDLLKNRDIKMFESEINTDEIESLTGVKVVVDIDTNRSHSDSECASTENVQELFSITQMIHEIEEQTIGLNDTELTNNSDFDAKRQAEKIAESVIHYVLLQAFFVIADKSKDSVEKTKKKVVTVVDCEDILYTAAPLWEVIENEKSNDKISQDYLFESDNAHRNETVNDASDMCDLNVVIKIVENEISSCKEEITDVELPKIKVTAQLDDQNDIYDVKLPEIYITAHLDEQNICTDNEDTAELKSPEFNVPSNTLDNVLDDIDEYLDTENNDCKPPCNLKYRDITETVDPNSWIQPEEILKDFEEDSFVSEVQNLSHDSTFNYFADVSCSETDEHYMTDLIESILDDLMMETLNIVCENVDKESNLQLKTQEHNMVDVAIENLDKSFVIAIEDYRETSDDDNNTFETQGIVIGSEFQEIRNDMVKDEYLKDEEDISVEDSVGIATALLDEVLNNSMIEGEVSCEDEQLINNGLPSNVDSINTTFIIATDEEKHEAEQMNTAFVEDRFFNGNTRFSSPVREHSKTFEPCDESPIKNPNAPSNLNVLYEKEESILGSPFVKHAPIIAMSQSYHSGGIKYWITFDENLKQEKPCFRRKKFDENMTPSFIAVDLDDSGEKSDDMWSDARWNFERETQKRVSVLEGIETNDFNSPSDSFTTALASKTASFKTCESSVQTPVTETSQPRVNEINIPPKKLIYSCTKIDLHTRNAKFRRQYYSWPPYEETLLYRIVSQFRMSESFDPSDLETLDYSL